MSVQVVLIDGALTALLQSEEGKTQKINLSPLDVLGLDLDRLLKPVVAELSLQRVQTAEARPAVSEAAWRGLL